MKLPIVMLPSLGRGAADFDQLLSSLATVGYQVIALDPPTSAPDDATLHDLAAVVLGELDQRGLHRVHLVGHAFGQRLARCVLADAPERVVTLTMLAAGGLVPMNTDIARALASCFDTSRTAAEHLDDVRKVFFADGNDASVWADGWLPDVAALQSAAVHRTPPGAWTHSVAERVLVVQGLQDVCAVPENGRLYVDAHREQATLVEIDGAGHALLPERPDEVFAALLTFFESLSD